MGRFQKFTIGLIALILSFAFMSPASAHKASDAYLYLTDTEQSGAHQFVLSWHIALVDLSQLIVIDRNEDLKLSWAELKAQKPAIFAYAQQNIRFSAVDGAADCSLTANSLQVDTHSDGAYAVLNWDMRCSADELAVTYRLFSKVDAGHRGILVDHRAAFVEGPFVLAAGLNPVILQKARFSEGAAGLSSWLVFGQYVLQGIWHIWIGFDHILFILSLLLPAVLFWRKSGRKSGQKGEGQASLQGVLRQGRGRWHAVDGFKPALLDLMKVISAFTLAHSITLTLASLNIISLPSQWVESAIALSVLVLALNNISPFIPGPRWLIAFGFGLLHGFGFASVLADLGLSLGARFSALLGFNVGVELGQLAILLVIFPVVFVLRQGHFYRRRFMPISSLIIAAIASLWLIERVFELQLIS